MLGIDTNVLVRYLTQDDAAQSRIASEIIESYRNLYFGHRTFNFVEH